MEYKTKLKTHSQLTQTQMKTVASVVEKYLKTKPFLLSSLSEGIINLTSLARIIMPEIELHLGKDIKQGAVVMALKRISEDTTFT